MSPIWLCLLSRTFSRTPTAFWTRLFAHRASTIQEKISPCSNFIPPYSIRTSTLKMNSKSTTKKVSCFSLSLLVQHHVTRRSHTLHARSQTMGEFWSTGSYSVTSAGILPFTEESDSCGRCERRWLLRKLYYTRVLAWIRMWSDRYSRKRGLLQPWYKSPRCCTMWHTSERVQCELVSQWETGKEQLRHLPVQDTSGWLIE